MASTEKIKEIIQSDEIRTFFEGLLSKQSRELLKELEQSNKEEVKKLENEKKEIEQKYVKLISDNEQLRDVINDCKSREKELIEKQEDLKKQIENLKTTEETSKGEIGRLTEKQKTLENKNTELERKNEKLDFRYKKYERIEQAYEEYKTLPEDIQIRLQNVFPRGNLFAFMTAGTKWENITGLWNFAKRRIIEKDISDIDKVLDLLEFLFEVYNKQYSKTMYEFMDVNVGDKFDSDLHNIIGINTDGIVSKVWLKGIYDVKNKKVLCKTLIEVQ